MKKLAHFREFSRRPRDERGASAVEYGLLVVAIAAIIVALVFVLGKYVKGSFQQTCDGISSHMSGVAGSCS